MLQTRVQDGRNSADSSLQRGAVLRNTAITKSLKPAIQLAFLVVIAGLVWLVRGQVNSDTHLEVPVSSQHDAASGLEAADEKAQVSSDPEVATEDGNTNSVKIESVTDNGVTNTKLEVNGEEVPVPPNGVTEVTLPNGDKSTMSVTTQNTQTSDGGLNYNSNTSTSHSFSHNYSSQNIVGGQ